MMQVEIDYYSALGVLPDAETVVITAAYRALASLYHPDRWKGDVAEATRRMAEVNVAYGVLGERERRKKYDSERSQGRSKYEGKEDDKDAAFDAALGELEDRWQVAVRAFPDLAEIRTKLSRTAHRLAFAYVTSLLESRQFDDRHGLAQTLEKRFLEQHFGTNSEVIQFARTLIGLGCRNAIVALNKYVDVLGSDVDSGLIISRIYSEYNIVERMADHLKAEGIQLLKKRVTRNRNHLDAIELLQKLELHVDVKTNGFFKPSIFKIRDPKTNSFLTIQTRTVDFVDWVIEHHCN